MQQFDPIPGSLQAYFHLLPPWHSDTGQLFQYFAREVGLVGYLGILIRRSIQIEDIFIPVIHTGQRCNQIF
jgi:hypothetical protein